MDVPTEIKLQEAIEGWLCEKQIFPYDVLYTSVSGGFLKISFIMKPEIQEFLDLIGYSSMADTSGIYMCTDGLTLIIKGMTLRYILHKISEGRL